MSRWQTLWLKVPADWYVDPVPSWTTDSLFWSLNIHPSLFLDASVRVKTCASGFVTSLPLQSSRLFVLETEFAVVIRSKTVDGLRALLEWSKKVFLLVSSNPEVIPQMVCINSDINLPYLFMWYWQSHSLGTHNQP